MTELAVDTSKVNTIQNTPKKPFRILALDGGGVRAIIQATLLKRLESEFPNLVQEADMFAGTSAGSIVSSALAIGMTPDQTFDMWTTTAPKIFVEGMKHKLYTLDDSIGASFSATHLDACLTEALGEKTLGELHKKILIPSFNLNPPPQFDGTERWEPEYFHNFPSSQWNDLKLKEAVLRSTAAPVYFPIRNGYVDGGTFANNPALAAVTTALNNGIKLEDIVVLSLSTGNNPKAIKSEHIGNGEWGMFNWAPHVIDLLLDANTESLDYSCRCLLKDQYKRVDPMLPFNIGLDDASKLECLVGIAEKVDLTATREWIHKFWKTNPNPDPYPQPDPVPDVNAKSGHYCNVM